MVHINFMTINAIALIRMAILLYELNTSLRFRWFGDINTSTPCMHVASTLILVQNNPRVRTCRGGFYTVKQKQTR